MKRQLFLLTAAGLLATAAGAQQLRPASNDAWRSPAANPSFSTGKPKGISTAKVTTATVFYTDTFSATSLTTGGWTAGGNTPAYGTWKFTKQASNSAFSIGQILSTTSAGGWMLYDSDSIGALYNNTPQIGYLTSPSINCSGHPYVGVRFQQYTERYQDTFKIQVSIDGGATFTSYNLPPNMALGTNESLDNPTVTTFNISAVAGNQPNVKVRFYYIGVFVGGGYSWMIDDFQMVDLDPVDLAVTKGSILMTLHNGLTPIGTMPLQFVDSVIPFGFLNNYGGLAQTNASVNAAIFYNNAPTSYTHSINFANVPVNATDTLADFSVFPGYVPAATGSYLVTVGVNQTSDGTPSNNVDTTIFNVSDSSQCTFTGFNESTQKLNPYWYDGSYPMYSSTRGSNYYGSYFELPKGAKRDTITSLSVCLAPGTTAGAVIIGEVYKVQGNNFISRGRTLPRTLTAADISTISGGNANLVFTNLKMNIGTGTAKSYTIADSGLWVAVIRAVSPTTAQTVNIAVAKQAAVNDLVGNYGIRDTASGLGGDFGVNPNSGNFFSIPTVPTVVVNYGDARKLLGVSSITGLHIGTPYPNPANTTVSISVSATIGAPVSVSLSDMTGRTVATKDLGTLSAGSSKTAVFATTTLPAGVYLCTVISGAGRETTRVVVAH